MEATNESCCHECEKRESVASRLVAKTGLVWSLLSKELKYGLLGGLAMALCTAVGGASLWKYAILGVQYDTPAIYIFLLFGAFAILTVCNLGLFVRTTKELNMAALANAGSAIGAAMFAAFATFLNIPIWTRGHFDIVTTLPALFAVIFAGFYWIGGNWFATSAYRLKINFAPVFLGTWLVATIVLSYAGMRLLAWLA